MRNGGDFLIVLAFSEKLQDFAFAGGQQLVAILHLAVLHLAHVILDQHFADGGAEESLAFADRYDGVDQIVLGGVLEQVGAGAGLQSART